MYTRSMVQVHTASTVQNRGEYGIYDDRGRGGDEPSTHTAGSTSSGSVVATVEPSASSLSFLGDTTAHFTSSSAAPSLLDGGAACASKHTRPRSMNQTHTSTKHESNTHVHEACSSVRASSRIIEKRYIMLRWQRKWQKQNGVHA